MSLPFDFKTIFEHSPNAYMVLDRNLRYVAANAAYAQVSGVTVADLLGRGIFDIFPHDPANPSNENATRLRQSFERVLASGETHVLPLIPYRVPRRRDGIVELEERYWSATHTPLLDARGEVAFILQHTVDVTELEELRRAAGRGAGDDYRAEAGVLTRAQRVEKQIVTLDVERQHLRRLFDQAPGFMAFLRGRTHVFEMANRAYEQLVGGRDIIGRPVREALPDVEGQGFFELLDQVFASGQPYVGRGSRVRLKGAADGAGDEVYLDFVYQPIFEPGGEVAGILVLGYDITIQKRQEAERAALLERERAMRDELEKRAEFDQQLVAIVSHDLRNPLNAISMAATLLLQRGQLDEQHARIVARIMSSTQRATRLIRDFLDFSHARVSGSIPIAPAPANIRDISRQVFDEVHLMYAGRSATVQHTGEETGLWDIDRIAQVIGNLVSNAFQHGSAAGAVRLATRGTADEMVIEVQNAGMPIPAEDLARLFEPFQRGTHTSAYSSRSIGLGLYIAREIVAAHGGAIAVHSTADEGTTFTVRLPRFTSGQPIKG
jgi:PAS domain S-box-containing protein